MVLTKAGWEEGGVVSCLDKAQQCHAGNADRSAGSSLEVDAGGGAEDVLGEEGAGVDHGLHLLALAGVDVHHHVEVLPGELTLHVRVVVAVARDVLDLEERGARP